MQLALGHARGSEHTQHPGRPGNFPVDLKRFGLLPTYPTKPGI
jgi:hypothetical protein